MRTRKRSRWGQPRFGLIELAIAAVGGVVLPPLIAGIVASVDEPSKFTLTPPGTMKECPVVIRGVVPGHCIKVDGKWECADTGPRP